MIRKHAPAALAVAIACVLMAQSVHTTANSRTIQTVGVYSFGEAAHWALHSSAYAEAVSRGVQDLRLIEDGSDQWFFYVMLGEDRGDHFCRCATLRVARDGGTVERLAYDNEGEEVWLLDSPLRLSIHNPPSEIVPATLAA